MLFSLAVFFLYCFALVIGAPLSVRVVVDPPITSPSATTVWTVGQQVTVTWDTSSIPEPKNFTGRLVLGFQTSDSENLDLDNPLATNISLIAGQVNVTVPNVPHKDSYIVVLFGDSGNASPQFTIAGGSNSTSSSFGSVPSSTTDPASTPASAAFTPTLFPLTSSGINPGGPFSSSGAPSITFTAPSASASTSPPSASSSGASSAPSASALGSSNANDARGVSAPVLSLLCGAMLALVTAF